MESEHTPQPISETQRPVEGAVGPPATTEPRVRKRMGLAAHLAALGGALVAALVGLWTLAYSATGQTGLARLQPSELGLVVDHLFGEVRVLERTGYHLFVPWLQEVQVFDRGIRTVRMGPGSEDAVAVEVRARDGSTFAFTGLELVLRPNPERLPELAAHFGTSFIPQRRFAAAAARALIAEEFGRLGAQEAMDSQALATGRAATRERLAARLAPLGITLEELTTPKPRLEREVERAIDERKLAQAESERLRIELERELERRPRRIEALAADQERERIELAGDQRRLQLELEAKNRDRVSKATGARRVRESEAQRRATELLATAQHIRTTGAREATRLGAEAAALEARGPLAVREALVEALIKTPIRIALAGPARVGGNP